jgi:hypothetical protein
MSVNSLVLCAVDNTCVKAYPEWTGRIRAGCNDETLLTTCDGIRVHFDIDAFLELGIIFTPYVKQRLLEALHNNGPAINSTSKRAIAILMEKDPARLKRWQCQECFDPNFITYNSSGHIVYAKGSSIDIVMDCCIKITPTMWCYMPVCDREFACHHPNFANVTSEWSPLFRVTTIREI